jgi:multicomponent Na+:H+ antiporter subunit D
VTDPAVLVALPLVASALPALLALARDRLGWPVAVATLSLQAALALALATRVLREGAVASDLGGVPAPYGIRLVVDGLAAPFVVLVAVASLGVLAYTRVGGPRSGPFYSLYLLLVAGTTGVCVTADVFNLYVFLEISGLAAYGLVASRRGATATLAALRYLLVGTVGASLYLFGVGYLYVATGTLSMAGLADAVGAGTADATLLLAGVALVSVGLAVKMALYPVHGWKPVAYRAAPAGVAALLAALISTVAAYALARLLFSVLSLQFLRLNPAVETLLVAVGGASVLAGSLLAVRARAVTGLLAYSSVVQFGVVVLGFAAATQASVTGAVVQLLGHAVMKAGLFLAAGLLAATHGARTLEDYRGLAERAPVTSAAVAVLAVGLVGLPPTVGFAGKFYVAVGAAAAGAWLSVALVVGSTLLSLLYFGRLLQHMYVEPAPGPSGGDAGAASVGMRGSVVAAAVATIGLGLGAGALERVLAPALEVLL